ncbi:MAG: DsrE family protein [Hyphomicrobiaceae bacterium]
MMRKLMIALAALMLAGTTATVAFAQTKTSKPTRATVHKLVIHVDSNDPATMTLALNNAQNVINHYKRKRERVVVELVTYGPGLHMYREDSSPVKQRIATMSLENPNLKFSACGNTRVGMQKREGKPVKLISEAKVVPSGVIRIMELQKQGYAYLRP